MIRLVSTHQSFAYTQTATVVYDSSTGAILHVHHVLAKSGVVIPDQQTLERTALEHAERLGHDLKNAQTLLVEGDSHYGPQRVDTVTKQLVPVEMKPRVPTR